VKNGRTHFAYKAEHAVDLETGAVVAVTVAGGAAGDTETALETLPHAGEQIAEVASSTNNKEVGERVQAKSPQEVVADRAITATTPCKRWRRKRKSEPIFRSPIVDGVVGTAKRKRNRQSMAIVGGLVASAGKSCCAGRESCWNVVSPMLMKPEECGAYTCEDEKIFSSGCSFIWPGSICRSSCANC
jgi:hypothetical protein